MDEGGIRQLPAALYVERLDSVEMCKGSVRKPHAFIIGSRDIQMPDTPQMHKVAVRQIKSLVETGANRPREADAPQIQATIYTSRHILPPEARNFITQFLAH